MRLETANRLPDALSLLPRQVLAQSVIVLLSLSSLAFVSGCGSSRPSDSQARKVAEHRCEGLVKQGAKFIDFRKQNGESKGQNGQQVYEYHFLASVELPAGYAWEGGELVRDVGPGVPHLAGYILLPKGAIFVSKGTITFRLTEKGWLSSDLVDRVTDSYCTDSKPEDCYEKLGWNKLE
jgi:hypothetical protein